MGPPNLGTQPRADLGQAVLLGLECRHAHVVPTEGRPCSASCICEQRRRHGLHQRILSRCHLSRSSLIQRHAQTGILKENNEHKESRRTREKKQGERKEEEEKQKG